MPHFKNGTPRRLPWTAVLVAVVTTALVLPLASSGASAKHSAQATVPLGDAASFGALSFTAMTNAGLDTVVHGNVGSSSSIDAGVTHPGFAGYVPPSVDLNNAQASLLIAYGNAEAQTPTASITGVNLAGQSLTAGVYNSTSTILISGPVPLTLNGGGNADSVFIFQATSDLTVDPTSNILYTNGAQPCNVFWKVDRAFLKNTGFTFVGTILALTQITLTDNITVEGRVLARNANVTFIHDTVNKPSTCVSQASLDAAAATAATAAANAAAAAAAAAQAVADAKAAADKAAAEKAAAEKAAAEKAVADAKTAADTAAKAAADAKAAAAAAAAAAKAADLKTAKAAAAKALAAANLAKAQAKVALAKAKVAKTAAVKAAQIAKAKKAAGATSTNRTLAKKPKHRFGFTG